MKSKSLKWSILIIALGLVFSFAIVNKKNSFPQNIENITLSTDTSQERISIDELAYWDNVIWEVVPTYPLENGAASRLFAYLYMAQKAFADASYAITGSYSGSLGPISLYVIQLFLPEYKYSGEVSTDPFSEELTRLLTKQIETRFTQEQANIRSLDEPKNKELWHLEEGKPYGLNISSIQPWALTRADEFRSPRPPAQSDQFWQTQASQVKAIASKATESQKKQILFWDGKEDPRASDWKSRADRYMEENKIPLEMRLEVRAKLAVAILDANIAAYDTKYTYLVKRPNMIDPEIETYIPTPPHPSYPAGHSTIAAAATTILSYYFPENVKEWEELAEECGMSRIRAGIHFPIDHTEGNQLGVKVGKAVLFRLNN